MTSLDQVARGKCSHCLESSEHTLEERSRLSRNIYVCNSCGKKTIRCRACDGMAKVGPLWADELCGDHWASGECWEDGELGCISQWPRLWKGNSSRLKRVLWAVSPYRGDAIDSFAIRRLADGHAAARVVCINGFMGQSDAEFSDWSRSGEALFPGHVRYGMRWESRRGRGFGEISKLIFAEAPLAVRTFGLSVLLSWLHTSKKAEDTGRMLAGVLMRANRQQFVLCGHSLGARVIFYALCELADNGRYDVVRTAHLMGGAVGVNDSSGWKKAISASVGGITNYFSRNDDVLKYLYTPAMGFQSSPIGLNRIPGARNIDVSAAVKGHNEYKDLFHSFASYPLGLGVQN